MKPINEEPLKLRQTTITVKYGTKRELDNLASRRDSYDDVIRKLIRENHELNEQLKGIKTNFPNKMYFSSIKRKTNSINIGNKKIFFEHNIPKKPLSYFRFDITYKKIIISDTEVNLSTYGLPLEMAEDYLLIYEKLLKSYIDPLFKLDKNRKLFDLDWWERKLKVVGLSYETFVSDIKEKLISFGVKL